MGPGAVQDRVGGVRDVVRSNEHSPSQWPGKSVCAAAAATTTVTASTSTRHSSGFLTAHSKRAGRATGVGS